MLLAYSPLKSVATLLLISSIIAFIAGVVISYKAFSTEPYIVERRVFNRESAVRLKFDPLAKLYPNEIYGGDSVSLYSDMPVYASLVRDLEVKYDVVVVNGRMSGEFSKIVKVIHQDGWYKVLTEDKAIVANTTSYEGVIPINLTEVKTMMERLSKQAGSPLRGFTLEIAVTASLEFHLPDGVRREHLSHSLDVIVDLTRNRIEAEGRREEVKSLEERVEERIDAYFISIPVDAWRRIGVVIGGLGVTGLALSQILLWIHRERFEKTIDRRLEEITIEVLESLEEATLGARVLRVKSLDELEKLALLTGKPVVKTTDSGGNPVYLILLDESLAFAFTLVGERGNRLEDS